MAHGADTIKQAGGDEALDQAAVIGKTLLQAFCGAAQILFYADEFSYDAAGDQTGDNNEQMRGLQGQLHADEQYRKAKSGSHCTAQPGRNIVPGEVADDASAYNCTGVDECALEYHGGGL